MKPYFYRTGLIVSLLFPNYLWKKETSTKTVYLTFDDGPTPMITEWVLEQLEEHNAKAAFFCIGRNISQNPQILRKVIESGHIIGNHTEKHLKGWDTDVATYIESVKECSHKILQHVKTDLWFRPPYGKIKSSQARAIKKMDYKIVMWDIISGDYDKNFSPEDCLENLLKKIRPGSIIVFHDSAKAFDNLKYVLPKTLEFLKTNGYNCGALTD